MAPRQFQSTRPVWGATCFAIFGWILFEFQSTRPVWGATFRNIADYYKVQVSIHAPRVGRDCHGHRWRQQRGGFNPRAPCGARRYLSGACPPTQCFNPRAPCGARHHGMHNSFHDNGFQSTRPVWGATFCMSKGLMRALVSIHAPRVGRDAFRCAIPSSGASFNPRAPCGARLSAKL